MFFFRNGVEDLANKLAQIPFEISTDLPTLFSRHLHPPSIPHTTALSKLAFTDIMLQAAEPTSAFIHPPSSISMDRTISGVTNQWWPSISGWHSRSGQLTSLATSFTLPGEWGRKMDDPWLWVPTSFSMSAGRNVTQSINCSGTSGVEGYR